MKKMIVIMLTMVIALVISACSGDKSSTTEDKTTTIETSHSAKEMTEQMVTEVEQPALMELTAEELTNLYNLDATKLEDFSVRVPMMSVKTNEIAIFKVKDVNDVAEVLAAVKQRAENVMKQFEQYLPDQYENAKNHKIVTKGNYVLFVISEQADKLITVYDRFFEEK
ncbi:DUF4358 domain-containing protein [Solibacillus sp. R5-41]|uniref:DUF4358 domain-containing protein n=1 Tax=Solibacillus sp. R5-41 TaxID=2048654 RepID=UPI0020A28942|nr:DUF4358 domain-containing protein [Solibacillus sp. R5-41]